MKKTIARFATVVALFGSIVLAGPTPVAAEGNGAGSGGAPPPKCMVATPDFTLYDNGLVVLADGTYGWAW
jgi:hypothetical protein